jgi:NADPH-dependent 2,4-dienoyl-CoA reductase/sulfur reductase-like enzyme
VGDCAQAIEFLTGRPAQIMLASTAAAEARILGYNLYSMRIKRNFPGTLSVFSTELAGRAFASAGVIESAAKATEIEFVVGQSSDVDRHPGSLEGAAPIEARLIVSAGDGQIIGGELFGGKSVGEMINTVALAIQKNMTVFELISLQLGTHLLLQRPRPNPFSSKRPSTPWHSSKPEPSSKNTIKDRSIEHQNSSTSVYLLLSSQKLG